MALRIARAWRQSAAIYEKLQLPRRGVRTARMAGSVPKMPTTPGKAVRRRRHHRLYGGRPARRRRRVSYGSWTSSTSRLSRACGAGHHLYDVDGSGDPVVAGVTNAGVRVAGKSAARARSHG